MLGPLSPASANSPSSGRGEYVLRRRFRPFHQEFRQPHNLVGARHPGRRRGAQLRFLLRRNSRCRGRFSVARRCKAAEARIHALGRFILSVDCRGVAASARATRPEIDSGPKTPPHGDATVPDLTSSSPPSHSRNEFFTSSCRQFCTRVTPPNENTLRLYRFECPNSLRLATTVRAGFFRNPSRKMEPVLPRTTRLPRSKVLRKAWMQRPRISTRDFGRACSTHAASSDNCAAEDSLARPPVHGASGGSVPLRDFQNDLERSFQNDGAIEFE